MLSLAKYKMLLLYVFSAWGMTETTGVSVILNPMWLGMDAQTSGKVCAMNSIKVDDFYYLAHSEHLFIA